MATLKQSEVRQRAATALSAAGFRESVFSYGEFGNEPNSLGDEVFVVGITQTGLVKQRHRTSSPGLVINTELTVKISEKLKPKAKVSSYDAGLDSLQAAWVAVMGMSRADINLQIGAIRAPEILRPSREWVSYSFTVVVQHLVALS